MRILSQHRRSTVPEITDRLPGSQIRTNDAFEDRLTAKRAAAQTHHRDQIQRHRALRWLRRNHQLIAHLDAYQVVLRDAMSSHQLLRLTNRSSSFVRLARLSEREALADALQNLFAASVFLFHRLIPFRAARAPSWNTFQARSVWSEK